MWPDAGRARLEISPSTHTLRNTSSSSTRARPLSWLTVRTSRSRPSRSKGSLIMAGIIKDIGPGCLSRPYRRQAGSHRYRAGLGLMLSLWEPAQPFGLRCRVDN
ncbi:hypothetical protein D3C72_2060020 [compost metagenome]